MSSGAGTQLHGNAHWMQLSGKASSSSCPFFPKLLRNKSLERSLSELSLDIKTFEFILIILLYFHSIFEWLLECFI